MWACILLGSGHRLGATGEKEFPSPTSSSLPVTICCVSRALGALGTTDSFQLEIFPIEETIKTVHGNLWTVFSSMRTSAPLARVPPASLNSILPQWYWSKTDREDRSLEEGAGEQQREPKRPFPIAWPRFLLKGPPLVQIPRGKRWKHECDAHYRYPYFSTKVSMQPKQINKKIQIITREVVETR